MSSYARLCRIVSIIAEVTLWFCVLLMAVSALLLCFDIVLRLFFRSSLNGAHEIVTIIFTAVFLLGTGALYARSEDVVFTFLLERLPARLADLATAVVLFGGAATMAMLAYAAGVLTWRQRFLTTPALELPMYLHSIPVVVGCTLVAFAMLVQGGAPLIRLAGGTPPSIPVHNPHN